MSTRRIWMRRLVYAYFFLLIFEGALRKWILPSLSGPLLLIRDPFLLAIYILAIFDGAWPRSMWVRATLVLAALCMIASFAVGCPIPIALFGLRTDFWQIPLIFLMPVIFDLEEVRQVGRCVLIILPGMALLALVQFRAGPGSWLNKTTAGTVGVGAGQLYAALGRVRPSGKFSFVTGMVSFLALSSAFILEAFIEGGAMRRLWPVTVALVLALGVSGSRSAILGAGVVAAIAALICIGNPRQLGRIPRRAFRGGVACFFRAPFPLISAGLDVNRTRFAERRRREGGGIIDRWLGNFAAAGIC